MPLYTNWHAEQSVETIAGELNVPTVIRRRALAADLGAYYGPGKSLCLYDGSEPISAERIAVADLSGWSGMQTFTASRVMLDPLLGRFVFPPRRLPKDPQVSYHYGFSAAIGGGGYRSPSARSTLAIALLREGHLLEGGAAMCALFVLQASRVLWLREQLPSDLLRHVDELGGKIAPGEALQHSLREAINRVLLAEPWDAEIWLNHEPPSVEIHALLGSVGAAVRLQSAVARERLPRRRRPQLRPLYCNFAGRGRPRRLTRRCASGAANTRHAVIEIADSGMYIEPINIELEAQQSLEIRAALGCRP